MDCASFVRSKIKNKIPLTFPNFHKDNDIKYFWKLLKYETGSFFGLHKDGKMNAVHIGTLLLLPPKNNMPYEGGELCCYDDNNNLLETFTSLEQEWLAVILNINTLHEVKPIISGTRYVLKAPIIVHSHYFFLHIEPTITLDKFNYNNTNYSNIF